MLVDKKKSYRPAKFASAISFHNFTLAFHYLVTRLDNIKVCRDRDRKARLAHGWLYIRRYYSILFFTTFPLCSFFALSFSLSLSFSLHPSFLSRRPSPSYCLFCIFNIFSSFSSDCGDAPEDYYHRRAPHLVLLFEVLS